MSTLSLTVADTALSLNINDRDNLLNQCLAAGLPVARSCRNGNCGRCDCQLEFGRVQLRNGKLVTAPATIALCVSHARSPIGLNQLPLASPPQHWRCQGLGPQQLQLPAGRQTPPNIGDKVALLFSATVTINSVAAVNGRVISLQDHCAHIASHIQNQDGIGLLNIDSEHHGNFVLWHRYKHCQTLLWPNINQSTGLAAQAAYRHGGSIGHYQLRAQPPTLSG